MKNAKYGRRKQIKTWTLSEVLDLLRVVLVLADIILKFLR